MNWKRFSDELPPENTTVFVAKEYAPEHFTYGTAWWLSLNNDTLVFDDAMIGSYNLATMDRTKFYWCEITPPGTPGPGTSPGPSEP